MAVPHGRIARCFDASRPCAARVLLRHWADVHPDAHVVLAMSDPPTGVEIEVFRLSDADSDLKDAYGALDPDQFLTPKPAPAPGPPPRAL
jgi:hypothetical protein